MDTIESLFETYTAQASLDGCDGHTDSGHVDLHTDHEYCHIHTDEHDDRAY